MLVQHENTFANNANYCNDIIDWVSDLNDKD